MLLEPSLHRGKVTPTPAALQHKLSDILAKNNLKTCDLFVFCLLTFHKSIPILKIWKAIEPDILTRSKKMFTVELNQIIDNEIPAAATTRQEYQQRLDILKEMQEDIKALVQATKEMAVEDGYAEMKEGKRPELAPTQSMFIELYGQEEFDRVKRLGVAKKTFTWLDV